MLGPAMYCGCHVDAASHHASVTTTLEGSQISAGCCCKIPEPAPARLTVQVKYFTSSSELQYAAEAKFAYLRARWSSSAVIYGIGALKQ